MDGLTVSYKPDLELCPTSIVNQTPTEVMRDLLYILVSSKGNSDWDRLSYTVKKNGDYFDVGYKGEKTDGTLSNGYYAGTGRDIGVTTTSQLQMGDGPLGVERWYKLPNETREVLNRLYTDLTSLKEGVTITMRFERIGDDTHMGIDSQHSLDMHMSAIVEDILAYARPGHGTPRSYKFPVATIV